MITDTKLRKALGKKRDDIEIISDSHGLNARISQAGKYHFSIGIAGPVKR